MTKRGNEIMKKTDIIVAPLFSLVVVLLSIGALGELFSSLFSKAKNLSSEHLTEQETALSSARQIK